MWYDPQCGFCQSPLACVRVCVSVQLVAHHGYDAILIRQASVVKAKHCSLAQLENLIIAAVSILLSEALTFQETHS